MIEHKKEMKSEHRTVITECRNATEKGNEKMRTRETVVAVLKHKS